MVIIKVDMYNIIVNPVAGKNKARRAVKKVSKYLKSQNIEFLVFFSENSQHITDTTKTLCKNGEKDFIVIGGDGTLHHFVNGLVDPSKVNFGIIPAGKHNHFAKYLSIPSKPLLAIKNILEHPTIKIDYLKCNEYRSLNLVSCGAIEQAEKHFQSQEAKKRSFNSILNYTLKTYTGIKLAIEADNFKQKEKLYTSCSICNGGFYGNNIYISPLSNMHDGLANLVTLNYEDNKSIKRNYLTAKRGKHIYKDFSSTSWTSFAHIKSNADFDAILDGELYKFNEIEINVIANGLNIYTKK